MFEEQQCSLLQQFSPNQDFVRRFTNREQGTRNTIRYVQTSVWNIDEFITKQIKQANEADSEQKVVLTNNFIEQLFNNFQKELPFNEFLLEMKKIEDIKKLDHKLFAEIHISFSKVFLRQCIFFVLTLLPYLTLSGLNKELSKGKNLFLINLEKLSNKSQLVFTLRFTIKEEDSSSTLGSKEKISEDKRRQEIQNKGDNNSENHSDPWFSQKNQSNQENILMTYLKRFLSSDNFVILVSKKAHIYLISKTDKLGEGGFGSVFKSNLFKLVNGKYIQSMWAIKELKRDIEYFKSSHKIGQDREHEMLSSIPYLSGIKKSCFKSIIQVQEVIACQNKKYIVYEFCAYKDLNKFLRTNNRFTKKHLFMIIYQLAATLALMHYQLISNEEDMRILDQITMDQEISMDKKAYFYNRMYLQSQVGIIHRDLKLSNILVSYFSDTQIKIKIIDWAFSKRTLTEKPICSIHCGTVSYQAPQILNRKLYCCKVDVWAFGVIVYELLTGKQFMRKEDKERAKESSFVKNKLENMQLRTNMQFSAEEIVSWKKLVSKCLQFEPQNRFSSKEVFNFLRKCSFYQPYNSQSIHYVEELKMMRAQYFHHHNCITHLNPPSIIRRKILMKIAGIFQSALQQIYEKFTRNKYWESQKPEINWQFSKIIRKYNQKSCSQQYFNQCIQMLEDNSFKQYPHNQSLKQLILKVHQIYFSQP